MARWYYDTTGDEASPNAMAGVARLPCTLRWCVRGVVCSGGCGRRGPRTLSCLGVTGSGWGVSVVWYAWCYNGTSARALHGGCSFGVVQRAPLLTSANVWSVFGI